MIGKSCENVVIYARVQQTKNLVAMMALDTSRDNERNRKSPGKTVFLEISKTELEGWTYFQVARPGG